MYSPTLGGMENCHTTGFGGVGIKNGSTGSATTYLPIGGSPNGGGGGGETLF